MPVDPSAPTGTGPRSWRPGPVDGLDTGRGEGPSQLRTGHGVELVAPWPGGVDHQVRKDLGAVFETDSGHPVVLLQDLGHRGVELDAATQTTGGFDQVLVGSYRLGVATETLVEECLARGALVLDLTRQIERHPAGGERREQLGHVVGTDGLGLDPLRGELVGVRPHPVPALPHHPEDTDPLQA